MEGLQVGKIIFSGIKRDFLFQAWHLTDKSGDALVQIWHRGYCMEFLWPAYKIWNITAHADDIINSILANNMEGFNMAAWNGITKAEIVL